MSDAIFEHYKKITDQAQAEANDLVVRNKEEEDRKRSRILDNFPRELDKMFERLRLSGYSDMPVKGVIRQIKTPSGEIRETVAWPVGYTRLKYGNIDNSPHTDRIYVCHDRTFCRTTYAHPSEMSVLEELQMSDCTSEEVQSVLDGFAQIGARP